MRQLSIYIQRGRDGVKQKWATPLLPPTRRPVASLGRRAVHALYTRRLGLDRFLFRISRRREQGESGLVDEVDEVLKACLGKRGRTGRMRVYFRGTRHKEGEVVSAPAYTPRMFHLVYQRWYQR